MVSLTNWGNNTSERYYRTDSGEDTPKYGAKTEEEIEVSIEELERELRILRGEALPSDFGDPFENN